MEQYYIKQGRKYVPSGVNCPNLPWWFGDKAQKSTCLWLKNLPNLMPTDIVEKGEFFEFTSKKGEKKRMPMWYYKAFQEAKTPEERRGIRSKTFQGVADAMAKQWSEVI